MKKFNFFALLAGLLFISLNSMAQDWTILGNGGTNPTTNFVGTTDNKDFVFRTFNIERFRMLAGGQLQASTAGGIRLLSTAGNTAAAPAYTFNGDVSLGMYRIGAGTLGFTTAGAERLRITNTGNIGIGTGTVAPAQRLHVAGSVLIDGPNSTLLFGEVVGSPTVGHYGIEYQIADKGLNFWKPFGSFNNSGGQGFQNNILFMNDDGRIGMGVSPSVINAAGYTHRLSVCGSIRATEVVVQVGWCDYVFNENYSLMPLAKLRTFIEENHHLPEVTPGPVVEADGLKLAEMSAMHMKKIEELTLYLLEQNEQMEELKAKMEAQINDLKVQLEAIKN